MTTRVTGLVAAAIALAVLGLVLMLAPGTDQGSFPAPTVAAPSATADPDVDEPSLAADPHDGDPDHDHGEPSVLREQHRVVAAFARAFTSTGPQKAWLADLKPYVTADLYQGLTNTDPTRRPIGRVKRVTAIAEPTGLFTVLYDNGSEIQCTLTESSGGWLVSQVEPIRPPDQSGTDV